MADPIDPRYEDDRITSLGDFYPIEDFDDDEVEDYEDDVIDYDELMDATFPVNVLGEADLSQNHIQEFKFEEECDDEI